MKDQQIIEALEAIPESADLGEWAEGFVGDLPEKFRKYRKLTENQRKKALEIIGEHGELPGIVVGEDGILSGPLPCGHDIQGVRKSEEAGVYCARCFNS